MLILSSCPDILLHTVLQKHSNTFDIVYMRAYKTDLNSLNFIYILLINTWLTFFFKHFYVFFVSRENVLCFFNFALSLLV